MGLPSALHLGLVAAAVAVAATSTGDLVLLGGLLVLLAGLGSATGPAPSRAGTGGAALAAVAAVGVLAAMAAVAFRWGTTSLAAVAGAQAVLGPAAAVAPLTGAASAVLAGGALVLAAGGQRGWSLVPFGLVGGLVVAGPSAAGGVGDLALRLLGAAAGMAAAAATARWLPSWVAAPAAATAGAAALALGLLA